MLILLFVLSVGKILFKNCFNNLIFDFNWLLVVLFNKCLIFWIFCLCLVDDIKLMFEIKFII